MVLCWLLACDPGPAEVRRERSEVDSEDSAGGSTEDTGEPPQPAGIGWTSPTDGELVDAVVRVDVTGIAASDRAIDEVTAMSLMVDGVEVAHEFDAGIRTAVQACPDASPFQVALSAVATTAGGAESRSEVAVARDFPTLLELSIARSLLEGPDREAHAWVSGDEDLVAVEWRIDDEVVATHAPAVVDASNCEACSGACWGADLSVDLRPYLSRATLACTVTTASGDELNAEAVLEFDRDADDDGRDAEAWGEDDCDDTEPTVYFGAHEYCDRLDNDCDGDVDESCSDEPTLPVEWTVTASASAIVSTAYESELGLPMLAGDYNGDGATDLVMGAPYYDGYPNWWGAVYFAPGPFPTSSLVEDEGGVIVRGDANGALIGRYLAAGDDYDGDGCDDAFLARCDELGGCWFSGASVLSGITTEVGHFVTYDDDEGIATYPSSSGDMSGDGQDDLVVASYDVWSGSDGGRVTLVTGPFLGDVATADSASVVSGTTDLRVGMHAWAGDDDLDGDGNNDLVVPASTDAVTTDEIDAVVVFYGPLNGGTTEDADATLTLAAEAGDEARPQMVGDLDGDGTGDLALGLPYADDAGPNAGKALVQFGPLPSGTSAGWAGLVALGEGSADYAGWAVAGIEKERGPGVFVVGAPGGNGAIPYSGVVYQVTMPASGTLELGDVPSRWVGDSGNSSFGAGLLTGHDLDADAQLDVVIADPSYWAIPGAALIFPEP